MEYTSLGELKYNPNQDKEELMNLKIILLKILDAVMYLHKNA